MLAAPSGHQFDISAGEHRATIVEVGAAIRRYEIDGFDVLDPFDENAMADGARGMPLLPWPNRLGDGRYSWDGITHQLPLTEPAQGNAIHGLLGWRSWTCVAHEPSRVVMRARLLPSPGYPFALLVDVAYALSDTGLRVETSATNVGTDPCPYGTGHHPYLSAGGSLD
ncbi:MAG: aldose 1-epimerase family protein, partial [Acidimicrobiales bacterium]